MVYFGNNKFPYGLAEVQKMKLISKSLVNANTDVTVINRKGMHDHETVKSIKVTGRWGKVKYIYACGSPLKPKSFFKRNIQKLIGVVNELKILNKLSKKGCLDAAIISSKEMSLIWYYYMLSKIFKFKTVLTYAEYNSAIKKEKNDKNYINQFLFDRYVFHFTDGVLPISEFLAEVVKAKAPGKPILKIPVLCDFEQFIAPKNLKAEKYFLFCGAANLELINFIIDAFDLLKRPTDMKLYLVVNGKPDVLELLQTQINSRNCKDEIKSFSRLPYKRLVELYNNASALLIPLRPMERDIARFPHKIGEYTASGNPIITTNIGEIKYYFKDLESALIADNYDVKEFAQKMKFVIDHPEDASEIGLGGKKVGLQHFEYNSYGLKLKSFIGGL